MKRALARMIAGAFAGGFFLLGIYVYCAPSTHVGSDRPQVLVASQCGASEFVMYVVENAGSGASLLTIPVDSGELRHRACRHTLHSLAGESVFSRPLQWLPSAFVCTRLMRHGQDLERRMHVAAYPAFLGDDGAKEGVSLDRLRAAGLHVGEAEYDDLLRGFASSDDETPSD